MLSLSTHSLVEAEPGQQDRSQALAELPMGIVEDQGLQAVPEASMAFTALGRSQAGAGERADAMATVEQGLALRRKDPALAPWLTLHHLLVAARVAVHAGELSMARELLAKSTKQMDWYSGGMGPMRARLGPSES